MAPSLADVQIEETPATTVVVNGLARKESIKSPTSPVPPVTEERMDPTSKPQTVPILSRLKQWTDRLNPMTTSRSSELGTTDQRVVKSPTMTKRHGGLARLFSRSSSSSSSSMARSSTPQPERSNRRLTEELSIRCSSLDNVAPSAPTNKNA